nr:RNA-directed DNA polymerase, eukaryota [Tanacetum cinerariifolium]
MIGIAVMKHIRTKLGNGDKTMFWDDKWCAGDSLKDRFSRMYPRGGIEMEQFVKMEEVVNEINLTTTDDRWVWDLESMGVFSVSSIRNLIDEKTLPVTDFKTIWNKFVSIKINILTWKIMTNSLPTIFNISRRGICIDSILCANCDKGVETSSHLFFSCSLARSLANHITRWWSLPDMELDSYEDWINWFDIIRLPLKNKKMLEGVFFASWWFLWLFRNRTIFDAKMPKKTLLLDDVLFGDWQWRLATSSFAFGGLDVYSASDVFNYAFLASRLQSAGLQTKLLRHTSIVSPVPIFDEALSVFNTSMETDLLSNPTGKEVDIGLDEGRDKPLRLADMLLYSWDGRLDVCVDLTGSSPLAQTRMVDFVPGQAVIDAAQRKRGKYMAKCAAIGYGFLPFSFYSFGELEAHAGYIAEADPKVLHDSGHWGTC